MSDDEWQVIEKGEFSFKYDTPTVTVPPKGEKTIYISMVAMEAMGNPTAVRVYHRPGQFAFEPTNRGDRHVENCYVISKTTNGNNKLKSATMGSTPICRIVDVDERTAFELTQDDDTGYWVFSYE